MRCPYMFWVVANVECPRRLEMASGETPARNSSAAWVCRSPAIVIGETLAYSTSRRNVFESDSGFSSPPPRFSNTGWSTERLAASARRWSSTSTVRCAIVTVRRADGDGLDSMRLTVRHRHDPTDRDLAGVEVDVCPSQPDELTTRETGSEQHKERREEPMPSHRAEEGAHLVRCPDRHHVVLMAWRCRRRDDVG